MAPTATSRFTAGRRASATPSRSSHFPTTTISIKNRGRSQGERCILACVYASLRVVDALHSTPVDCRHLLSRISCTRVPARRRGLIRVVGRSPPLRDSCRRFELRQIVGKVVGDGGSGPHPGRGQLRPPVHPVLIPFRTPVFRTLATMQLHMQQLFWAFGVNVLATCTDRITAASRRHCRRIHTPESTRQ